MTASAFIAAVQAAGGRVYWEGGGPKVWAPTGALSAQLRAPRPRLRSSLPRGEGSRAIAGRVLEIVAELPVTPTVRQVYYLLVSDGLIPKTELAYKSLVRQLGRMRKGGVLAYDALIDGTRER